MEKRKGECNFSVKKIVFMGEKYYNIVDAEKKVIFCRTIAG